MSFQSEPLTDDAHLTLRDAFGQRCDQPAGVDTRRATMKQREWLKRRAGSNPERHAATACRIETEPFQVRVHGCSHPFEDRQKRSGQKIDGGANGLCVPPPTVT